MDEVIASDSGVRMKNGVDHYLVCDKKGNCAVIEFLAGKRTYYTGRKLPIKVLANSPYQESVKAWQANKYSDESLSRFGRVAGLAQKYKPTNNKAPIFYAFYLLSHAAGSMTNRTIVFDNRNFQVFFFTGSNPGLRQIDFRKLDFSGATPVGMLAVDDPLAGDISEALRSYSHQAALNHMLRMIPVLEPNVTKEQIMSLLKGFEAFPYAKNSMGILKEK